MRVSLTTIVLLAFNASVLAQPSDSVLRKSDFAAEIYKINNRFKSIEKSNFDLQKLNSIHKLQIDSLHEQLSIAETNLQTIADSLHFTTINLSSAKQQTQNQIQDINQTIAKRTIYWVSGILASGILILFAFIILRKRLTNSTKSFDTQIFNTNKVIEGMQEKSVKIDSELVQLLSTQLILSKEERKSTVINQTEPDHKLPKKVGEEIHRMRKRIENMPQDIKGLSALTNSLQRLEEEFNESGYSTIQIFRKERKLSPMSCDQK